MRSVAGPRIVQVMDGPRVQTFDVALAVVVAAALVVVMPVLEKALATACSHSSGQ